MKKSRTHWLQFIIFFLVIALLAACGGEAEEEAAEELEPPDHLHDTAWLVTAYQDSTGELVDVLEDTEISQLQPGKSRWRHGLWFHRLQRLPRRLQRLA